MSLRRGSGWTSAVNRDVLETYIKAIAQDIQLELRWRRKFCLDILTKYSRRHSIGLILEPRNVHSNEVFC